MKDGRKGKKGKKDFSRREIGGSDMDAFIDVSSTHILLLQCCAVVPPFPCV